VTVALLLEQLERSVLTERQVTVAMLAAGAKDVTVPDVGQAREEFMAALLAEPGEVDVGQLELMRALGVGRGR
jgi:hypothetical protein